MTLLGIIAVLAIGAVLVAAATPASTEGRLCVRRFVPRKPPSPLQRLEAKRSGRRGHRRAVCARIEADAALPLEQRPETGEVPGFVTMAVDLWLGRDFTRRGRAVGLSWLPFVGKPAHEETDEVARERLNRNYRLDEDERRALKIMSRKQGGRIAFAAARLADRLHRVPVARDPVLGELLATVDLVGEVTYLVDAAKALAEHDRLLGPPPVGASARDLDVVGTYIEKARALDARIDALLARLEALDHHRELVLGIQRQTDRDRWLEGVEAIGDLDSRSQAVADEMYAQSIRDATFETRARATVAMPCQVPLMARPTVAD